MTYGKLRSRRDANEAEIVSALRKAGVRVWHLDRPADLLTGCCGAFQILGTKKDKNSQFTDAEAKLFEDTIGYPRFRVETPEDALRALGLI